MNAHEHFVTTKGLSNFAAAKAHAVAGETADDKRRRLAIAKGFDQINNERSAKVWREDHSSLPPV